MEHYNIISVLKTFNNTEIKKFKKFVSSPYFNSNTKIVDLLNVLINYYPKFNDSKLNKTDLFLKIYPNKVYNDSTIKNLLFDLLQLSEKFMRQINMESKTFESADLLHEELFKRSLFDLLNKNIKNTNKLIDNFSGKGGDHFYNKYKLKITEINFNIINDRSNVKALASENFEKTSESGKYLIYYFISEVIQIYDSLLKQAKRYNLNAHESFLGKFFENFNVAEIITFINKNAESQNFNPLFEIYLYLIKMFLNVNVNEHYFNFKKLLVKYSDSIGNDEKYYLYGRLIDYCVIRNQFPGSTDTFINQQIEIYEQILLNGYYKHTLNEYLPLQLFRNILRAGLRAKKYDWTTNFINVYSEQLNPGIKKNMFNYSNAFMYFERKEYDKSLEYLSQVDLQYFVLKIDTRILLLKTYYETNYTEPAHSLIDTFKHFLASNETITHERKQMSKNFLKFTGRLLNIKDIGNTSKIHILKKEVENTQNVLEKDWLLEKINELGLKYKGAV